jgi:hypothetical protein
MRLSKVLLMKKTIDFTLEIDEEACLDDSGGFVKITVGTGCNVSAFEAVLEPSSFQQ